MSDVKSRQTEDPRIHASLRELIAMGARARGFNLLPKQPIGSLLSGRKRSRLRGRGLDFEELRHYRAGDDIRDIDWRVTNRTGKPHVRVYSEERDRPVIVVVDQRLPMFFGSQNKIKSVVACEVMALALWSVLRVGDRFGAVFFNDTEIEECRPSRGKGSCLTMLSGLVDMNHALSVDTKNEANPDQLLAAMKKVEQLVGHDYLVVVISDFYGWNNEVLKSMKRIGQHNDLVAGLVYDPLEKDIFTDTGFVISEGEYQVEVPAYDENFRKTYAEDFQLSIDGISQLLKKHDVPLLPINTVDACDVQLQRYLGGR